MFEMLLGRRVGREPGHQVLTVRAHGACSRSWASPRVPQGMKSKATVVAAILVGLAAIVNPVIYPLVHEYVVCAPRDLQVGTLKRLSWRQLQQAYRGKRALVVGGTRGVGRGVALTLASAGAHVVAVSRSQKSGEAIVRALRLAALNPEQQSLDFVQVFAQIPS